MTMLNEKTLDAVEAHYFNWLTDRCICGLKFATRREHGAHLIGQLSVAEFRAVEEL